MSYRLLIQSIRLAIYILVIFLTVANHLLQENFYNWQLMKGFYGWSAIGVVIHGLSLFKLDAFFDRRKLVSTSFVIDVVLISLLLTSSGLNQTLFLFMYLLTIILAGLVFRLRGALMIAALCSISFTLSSWFGPEVKAMAYLFMLILNNVAFFAMASLSGYLSDQLNLFAEKIESQNMTLRTIRRLNELIIETIPSGLMTVDRAGQIYQYNPSAVSLLGDDELENKNIFQLIPELENKIPEQKKDISFEKGGEHYFWGVQFLAQESEFAMDTYLVIIEDLTEKQKMEFSLRQSEKMAAVGGLAAGIAHEIRNPLAGISGSIELLSQNFSGEDDKKLVKIILREIDRLNNLISEFLDFAKPEKPPMNLIDIKKIIEECLVQAGRSVVFPVEVQNSLPAQLEVIGFGDKLKQAFLNIIINAFQAMENSPKKNFEVRSQISDTQVVLHFKDSGMGMKPETLKRIFEPFHTTKPKGTGLGLAITHKILESHSAKIFVESQEGLGTEFTISFPLKKR